MFTPGSKYFLGLTGLALVSAVLYCFLVNPSDLGAYALFGLFLNAAVITGFSFFTRDGDAETVAQAVEANAEAPAPSFWPIVFALGGALTLLGIATNEIVFVIGLAVLVGGGVEWMIQDWAERASSDSAFNQFVRHRAVGALDYPGLAAVALGVIAFLFSRIMLTVSKDQATLIFMIAATVIFVAGVLIGTKPALRGKATSLIVVVGALVLLVAGVVSGISGLASTPSTTLHARYLLTSTLECMAPHPHGHLPVRKKCFDSMPMLANACPCAYSWHPLSSLPPLGQRDQRHLVPGGHLCDVQLAKAGGRPDCDCVRRRRHGGDQHRLLDTFHAAPARPGVHRVRALRDDCACTVGCTIHSPLCMRPACDARRTPAG
jgi:hypothetical protein